MIPEQKSPAGLLSPLSMDGWTDTEIIFAYIGWVFAIIMGLCMVLLIVIGILNARYPAPHPPARNVLPPPAEDKAE